MMNSSHPIVSVSLNTQAANTAVLHGQAARRVAEQRAQLSSSQQIAEALALVNDSLAPQRLMVRAGDVICQAGDRFDCLYLLNTGFVKIVSLSSDGREQVVGLKFRGDWLGFDGIAHQRYSCDAVAMDTGEVWAIRYDALLEASLRRPALLGLLHQAMSREIANDRDSLMSVCTLPADARVADFLRYWADALAKRGLRTDQIKLRMTRAEIGNYLGMTLETVSRALSRLAKAGLIEFAEGGRRDILIPEVDALRSFIQGGMTPAPALLQ